MIFQDSNPAKTLKFVNIIHLISFFIQAVILVVVYIKVMHSDTFRFSDPQIITYLQYIAVIVALAVVPLNEYFIKQKLNKINQISELKEKVNGYFSLIIIKLSLIEMGSIIASVLYYLTGHKTFGYLAVILIIFFMISRPTHYKTNTDLNTDI